MCGREPVLVRELTAEERERCRAYIDKQARARSSSGRLVLPGRPYGACRAETSAPRNDGKFSPQEVDAAWQRYTAGESLRELSELQWLRRGSRARSRSVRASVRVRDRLGRVQFVAVSHNHEGRGLQALSVVRGLLQFVQADS